MLAAIAGSQLTADLKGQLALLVDDMRIELDGNPDRTEAWRAAHQHAQDTERTAATWTAGSSASKPPIGYSSTSSGEAAARSVSDRSLPDTVSA